jgi:hypothetical protein
MKPTVLQAWVYARSVEADREQLVGGENRVPALRAPRDLCIDRR